jgi:hypothetical protein
MSTDHFTGWVYEFHGNPDCDVCSNASGIYRERPVRARLTHAGCNCDIEPMILDGDYTVAYRDKVESPGQTYETRVVGVDQYINPGDGTVTYTFQESYTVTGSVSVGLEIENAFNVSGKYQESKTITKGVTVELDPGEAVQLDVIEIRRSVSFSATRVMLFADGTEVIDGTVEDQIEVPTGLRFETPNL